MATAKSTRSRGLTGTPAKVNPKDSGIKLEDNLNVFKSDNFDADGYVQSKCNSLNEKVLISIFFLYFLREIHPVIEFLFFIFLFMKNERICAINDGNCFSSTNWSFWLGN